MDTIARSNAGIVRELLMVVIAMGGWGVTATAIRAARSALAAEHRRLEHVALAASYEDMGRDLEDLLCKVVARGWLAAR